MRNRLVKTALPVVATGILMGSLLVSCSSNNDPSENLGSSNAGNGTTNVPAVSAEDFNTGHPEDIFSYLEDFSGLAAAGDGKVAVLLPDAAFSARWVTADEPAFKEAFASLGLAEGDLILANAAGEPDKMRTQAEQAITSGASVILMTNLDSGSGAAIQQYAEDQGVIVIDYDRLTMEGSAPYYVSFDNENVGSRMAEGLAACITKWNVEDPQIYELQGSPTDNNATLVKQGYKSVLDPLYDSGDATLVGEEPTRNWDREQALKNFEQAYTAHPEINTVASYSDSIASAAISVLKNNSVQPFTVPTVGQDSDLANLQYILEGYQCMSVYKPIYREAGAAALLAMMIRAGVEPPAGLMNGMYDAGDHEVPSLLLDPESVTPENMNDTVLRDGHVSREDLCSGGFEEACKTNGI